MEKGLEFAFVSSCEPYRWWTWLKLQITHLICFANKMLSKWSKKSSFLKSSLVSTKDNWLMKLTIWKIKLRIFCNFVRFTKYVSKFFIKNKLMRNMTSKFWHNYQVLRFWIICIIYISLIICTFLFSDTCSSIYSRDRTIYLRSTLYSFFEYQLSNN